MRRYWLSSFISQAFALVLFFAGVSYLLGQVAPAFRTLFLGLVVLLFWLGVAGVFILLEALTADEE
jgi:hypothetical protein